MAQAGYTPISLYYSTTASAVPAAGNLVPGELAINITDGKLYYEDNLGAVQLIASKAGSSGDVVGPASSTDNAVVRFDGTSGKLVQNSAVTIADTTGDITAGAYNKVTVTAPATSATLTIADGKTLTANNSITIAGTDGKTVSFSNSITFAGTDSTTMTFPATSQTIVGLDATQTLTNKTLTDPAIVGTILEDVYTISDGAAFEVDPGNGSIQLITLGASRTPKATNFAAGESVTLMVDDGSAYTLTWTDSTWGTGGVAWVGGSAPTLATTGYTVIEFWKVGTQVYGALVGTA